MKIIILTSSLLLWVLILGKHQASWQRLLVVVVVVAVVYLRWGLVDDGRCSSVSLLVTFMIPTAANHELMKDTERWIRGFNFLSTTTNRVLTVGINIIRVFCCLLSSSSSSSSSLV